ncbi:hypothetical protein [Microbacterium sp. Root180]|uniref:hypothetical protein n=1 Tax=Microbacterium sp. Root180 TaxID=1736483 RepID=UPI0006FDA296|nr:hypothetical protein [Microbacterium sp. Root180]KRB38485.1 hypothetical protein ASD93_00480 [Microbacterium sp. Root180]
MRRSSLAAALPVLVAVILTMTGCATPAPVETPAASSPAEPTPTIEPVVIGPAEMPPVAFGGDCANALTPEDIAEALGTTVVPRPRTLDESIANVGGLECEWRDANGNAVILAFIPRVGLDGAVFPEELAANFFDECTGGSYCAWQGGDDIAWVALTLVVPEGTTRGDVDGWGEALGQLAIENYSAAVDDPWTRDRTAWFPTLACEEVGDAIGAQLGVPIVGRASGWDADRPPTGYVMALGGSRQAHCYLTSDGGQGMSVTIWPGLGETLAAEGATNVDFGVPGVTAYEGGQDDYRGRDYILTDGVNRIDLWVRIDDTDAQRRFAVAVAAAAASGFE